MTDAGTAARDDEQTARNRDGERVLWAELTQPEIERARDRGDLVLLPLGAIEQHGAHLPVDTDIALAAAVAHACALRMAGILIAPPIPWGYSASHIRFAGTISLRPDTLTRLLEDICGSIAAHGFTRIAIVASHATNRPIGNTFVREFHVQHGGSIAYLHYTDFARERFQALRRSRHGGEMHAGELETALQLHLHPQLVQMEHAVADYVDPKRHFGVSTAASDITSAGNIAVGYDVRQRFPTGVMGDATLATAELGKAVFGAVVDGMVTALEEYRSWDPGDAGRDPPYLDPNSWHV